MRNTLYTTLPACAVLVAGCLPIDPKPDYERASALIGAATGVETIYQPGDDEMVAAHVEALLVDGLSADEAVQLCLLNNLELQASFLRIGAARADVVQSQLFSNPTVGASFRFPSGGGLTNIEASMAQDLLDLWQMPIRKNIAERELNRVVLDVAHRAARLATDAKSAYYEAVAGDRLLEIAHHNQQAAKRLVRLTETLQETGAGSGVDVNLSLSELKESEIDRRRARQATIEARIQLARLLGVDIAPDDLNLTDPLPEPAAYGLGIENVLQLAINNRLDIAAAREELESSLYNIRRERQRVFPRIELGIEVERESRPRSSDGNFVPQAIRTSIQNGAPSLPPHYGERDAGATITTGPSLRIVLPLFDQNQVGIAKAHIAHAAAGKRLQLALLDLTHDARIAHHKARLAWDTAMSYQYDILPLRETNLELARDAYRAGKTPLVTVLDAQRTLQDATSQLVHALRDSALALLELESVTGVPIARNADPAKESKRSDETHDSKDPDPELEDH